MTSAEFKALRKRAFALGRMPSARWTFAVGLGWVRRVTVQAVDEEQAHHRAQAKCDRLDAAAGRESPVSHTLYLIEMKVPS